MLFSGEGSLLTVGPPGTGKSRGVAVWNLLRYPGSMLVTDPKGELAGWSADVRRKKLGQNVAVCDPFGVTGRRSTPVNPLVPLMEAAQGGRGLREETRRLALLLLPDLPGSSKDPYWREGARNLLITGLLYLAVLKPERCHLAGLHELLWKNGAALRADVLEPMRKHGGALLQYAGDVLDAMSETGKQFSTFRQEARHALAIFAEDEPCGRDTMGAGLDLSALLAGNLTVYLVLPPENVASHGRWMGLVVSAAIQEAMRFKGHGECVYLLDEFPNLGKLPGIKEAVALLRGKGLRVWLFVQDTAQLADVYGKDDADALRAQAEVLQVLGCRSLELAKFIEDRAGKTTAKTMQIGMPDPGEEGKGPRASIGETGVPVLPASAVLEMPHGKQILIRHGYPVRIADVVLWDGRA